MNGSTSKITNRSKRLESNGIDAKSLDRIHAPLGLNMGAASPEEISISIVAELILDRRLGKVQATRRKRSHDRRRDAVQAGA
jgi:xanthine dehydrogenase accessory factor